MQVQHAARLWSLGECLIECSNELLRHISGCVFLALQEGKNLKVRAVPAKL